MSAASPKVQDKSAEKAAEPSMEEILASIRRIIADDQAPRPAERAGPSPDDVLDLADIEPIAAPSPTGRVRPAEPVSLDLDPIEFGAPDADRDGDDPRPGPDAARGAITEPAPDRPAPSRPGGDGAGTDRLTSASTDASVNQAFNLLAHTVLTNNARTLEDLVKDMLRPMLKAWLDDNLPVVVERLVRAEIERVSRGR